MLNLTRNPYMVRIMYDVITACWYLAATTPSAASTELTGISQSSVRSHPRRRDSKECLIPDMQATEGAETLNDSTCAQRFLLTATQALLSENAKGILSWSETFLVRWPSSQQNMAEAQAYSLSHLAQMSCSEEGRPWPFLRVRLRQGRGRGGKPCLFREPTSPRME